MNTEYGPRPQRISCQFSYIRTFPGALKVIQFVHIYFFSFLLNKKFLLNLDL
jgi:hypothetical protein